MSTAWVLLLGASIVIGFGTFALLVGVSEAGDADAVHPDQKLPRWERALVRMRRKRAQR